MISDIEFQRRFCVGQVDNLLGQLEGVDYAPLKDAMYEVLFTLRSSLNVPNTSADRAKEIAENNKAITLTIAKTLLEWKEDGKTGYHLEGELLARFNEMKDLFFGSARKLTEDVMNYILNVSSQEQSQQR